MSDVIYVKGTGENLIQMMDWTPGADTAPGTVVVIGDTPCVAMAISRTGSVALANVLSSIRIRGGVYSGLGDAAMTGRQKVYWDNTAKKFTLKAAGNKHFGFTSPDTATTGSGQTTLVEHCPDGTPSSKSATGTVAAAGTNQATAAALTKGFNEVTGATGAAGVGVILPAGNDGDTVIVDNSDAANAVLLVYPQTGGTINALAANTAIQMAAKSSAIFTNVGGTAWHTTPKVPS